MKTMPEATYVDLEHSAPKLPEGIKSLAERLHACMGDIQYIKKRPKQTAPYPFVAHDDVTEAVRGLFFKHGILMLPSTREMRQNGNRCEMLVGVRLVNVEHPQDFMQFVIGAHGISSQDKGPGICLSYAVKMLLLKVLMIPTGEKDIEEYQMEHTEADPELVRGVLTALEAEDGATLWGLIKNEPDAVQMAVWRELNTKAKARARGLINEAKANEGA